MNPAKVIIREMQGYGIIQSSLTSWALGRDLTVIVKQTFRGAHMGRPGKSLGKGFLTTPE
jgi:hypothetical protein